MGLLSKAPDVFLPLRYVEEEIATNCLSLGTVLVSGLVGFQYFMIGVGKGKAPPRPPNRACGSPAHGSPVGGFLIGIGTR
jgi:hypothetical protein